EELFLEARNLFRLRISGSRQVDAGGEQTLRLHARIDLAQSGETLQEQTGAGEKKKGEGDFGDDQCIAQTMVPSAAPPGAVVQRTAEIEPRSLAGGGEPEKNARA